MNIFLKCFQKMSSLRHRPFEAVCVLLISLGAVLRLKHYLTNCSLWTDEAWVAVSIVSRSFRDIFFGVEIFPDFSKPPLGFLLSAKAAVLALGNHEYALRLFPLICGLASIVLFVRLLKKFQDKALTVLALGSFCLSPTLIYYSAELKQYSLDLLTGLVLFLVLGQAVREKLSVKRVIALGLLGSCAMWMSNAALFILAAFGLTLSIMTALEKRWSCLLRSLAVYACWAVSFWFLYKKFLSGMAGNTALFNSWQGAVLEAPLFSKAALTWIMTVVPEMFLNPLDFSFSGIGLVLFGVGVVSLFRTKKDHALMFFFAILIALLAAALHKYPFRGRLLLFLVPAVLIFVVQGLLSVGRKSPKSFSLALIIILGLLLFAGALGEAFRGFSKDYCREESREAIAFVKDHYRKGDSLLLNSAAQFPLWYYGSRLKLARDFEETWAGIENGVPKKGVKIAKFWEGSREVNGRQFIFFRYEYNLYDEHYAYVKSLVRSETTENDIYPLFDGIPFAYPMEGKRLWLILGNPSADFERIASGSLGLRFSKLDEFKRRGFSVYLYQMNKGQ